MPVVLAPQSDPIPVGWYPSKLLWWAVRLFIVAVFAVSAALKSHQLLYHPISARYWFQTPLWQILGIEAELLVGFLLFSGWPAHWVARIASGYLAVLAAISGSMLLLGESSCGCFGRWQVHPGWTVAFNLIALAGLAPFLKNSGESRPPRALILPPIVPAAILVFWGSFLFFGQPSIAKITGGWNPSLSHQKDLEYQELDTGSWPGKPLPILGEIETDQNLGQGRWMLILYHRDCPRCDRVILDSYQHEAILRGRLLLVEVPHLEPTYAKLPTSYGREIRMAKLRDSKKWLVSTPVLVHLDDGLVRKVGIRWDSGVLDGFSPGKGE